ncbi:MAG: histidine kinase [Flavipsychrobacter sp.]|nr:histidine kinase [Flavipsychrobacter sp.]
MNYLQYRFTPYFLIALFAASTGIIRIYIIPQWTLPWHILGFIVQTASLILIWHLIKWLSGRLDRRLPFERGPLLRMFVQILITLLVLSPWPILGMTVFRPYLPVKLTSQFIAVLSMMYVIVIFLFNFSFYASYFYRNWQHSVEEKAELEVQAAELEREKFNLQYHQLRNQVNPHYLFNTLSSLDGLIQTNPQLASDFVQHMSKVYRYVLQHKESEVVALEEELNFITTYIKLLQIRYGDGLQIQVNISEAVRDKGIVMVTLQMLLDNAIKHNMVLPAQPLKILVWNDGEYLVVFNNKQLRSQVETSNNKGLSQLSQLYGFLTDRKLVIEDTPEHFSIKIPLL